jgi:hypothetical protein
MTALHELHSRAGAKFTNYGGLSVVESFGNDTEAIAAIETGVAVCDRSHWGRLQVSDGDRLRFLHNQTTNDFQSLKPGQGCDTVFVTSTGRTIDLATAYVLEDSVLLVVSPQQQERLLTWMDRYIFFADRVALKDLTPTTAMVSVLGTGSDALLSTLGVKLDSTSYASHVLTSIAGIEIRIAVGSGLKTPGYTLITGANDAAAVWNALTDAGAVPMGEKAWEQLRIAQGRPMPDRELTDEFNPLEAGLWHTICLTKGCYIGQETIARLHTYQGVKQQLWGVQLTAWVEPNTSITLGDEKIGKLTSCTMTPTGFLGLAYIRTKAATAGLGVQVGAIDGTLVPLTFVSHEYL